jgi:ABC-type sugar transport system substrate-binding protein
MLWAFDRLGDRPLKVGVITGPAVQGHTIKFKKAIAAAQKRYSNIDVVQFVSGDYSVASGLSETNTLLRTHPDLDVIVSTYDDNTLGAVAALRSAGKSAGDVKIFDIGSSKKIFDLMKSGWVHGIMYADWSGEAAQGIEMLVAALQGRKYPRFNDVSRDPTLPNGTAFISPTTVSKYVPIG